MTISWHGQSFIVIKHGDITIVIDPFSHESTGIRPPKIRANFAFISHDHPDHNALNILDGEPIIFKGPGEYELSGIFCRGFNVFHDNNNGKKFGTTAIFKLDIDDLTLLHLSAMGESEIRDEIIKNIGDIDVMFIPIGGNTTISYKEAEEIISEVEPKIVIPIHYEIPGLKIRLDGPEKFIKEMGGKPAELDKLTLKKKDITHEETKIIILKP